MISDQGDFALRPSNVCPACGQKLKGKRRRICGICSQPILRGHKFTHDGSMVRHCNCAQPTERPSVTVAS